MADKTWYYVDELPKRRGGIGAPMHPRTAAVLAAAEYRPGTWVEVELGTQLAANARQTFLRHGLEVIVRQGRLFVRRPLPDPPGLTGKVEERPARRRRV